MSALAPPTLLRWLFLDLNSYFASVEQNEDPSLRHRPVAVLPLMSEYTGVIAASYEAKRKGVKTGTSVKDARRLCPGIVFVSGRHDLYVTYHHRILKAIESCIPVTDICSIDEVACRLDLSEQNPETATALAKKIKTVLRETLGPCITCSIGIAPSRLLGKIGSDMQKPDGLVILEPQDLPGRLLDLSLTDLPGINVGMATRLAAGGVTTIEQFWQMEPKQARRLWGGIQGERFWYELHGYDIDHPQTKRSSLSHSQVLAFEARPFLEARLVGRRLTQKLATRLRRMQYRAHAFALSLHSEAGLRWAEMAAMPDMTDSSFALLAAFEALWDKASREIGQPRLKKVGVWITDMEEAGQEQASLFDLLDPSAPRRAARETKVLEAVDSLNRKYGRDTVLIGTPAKKLAAYSGTKIAFSRIPDQAEFWE